MVHFGEFLKTWNLQSNSVTRQVSFNRTKIGGKCQNAKKLKYDSLSNFQAMFSTLIIIWDKNALNYCFSMRQKSIPRWARDNFLRATTTMQQKKMMQKLFE